MHGFTVHNVCLDVVLKPITARLDQCWWYLGGAGMSFPSVRPPSRLPPEPDVRKFQKRGPGRRSRLPALGKLDPDDLKRHLDELAEASAEYGRWLADRHGARVGKPGFFSRYAVGLDTNWQMYYASDAHDLDGCSFDTIVKRFDRNWFGPVPDDVPSDLFLITRDVDAAYVDLFLRDEWSANMVRGHLDKHGIRWGRFDPERMKHHR